MQTRSFKERIFHAVGFELVALITVAPLAAWIMDKPLFQMGALAVMLSTVAMLWNMIYNVGFDRLFPPSQPRSWLVRAAHALCFEGGFILIGLPIAAAMLNIPLWNAFLLEIGFFLFFLPYTMVWNWMWDRLRVKWVNKENCRA